MAARFDNTGPQKSWRFDKRKTSERGYGWRWQQARKRFLFANPLCSMCEAQNPESVQLATVVDHKIPHRGDQALFWDQDNWQPLCQPHHDRDKQAIEKSGKAKAVIGLDGWPVNS